MGITRERSNLKPAAIVEKFGKPTSIRNVRTKVFRVGPGGWYSGDVTIYRYEYKYRRNEVRYIEFYFAGDTYLSDGTDITDY